MINIRHSVFETNSSSTHSLSISNSTPEMYDTILPDSEGKIILTGGQFGWEWERYNDSLVKANYLAVTVFNREKEKAELIEVLKNHTGAKEVVFNFNIKDYDGVNWSYIDHDSEFVGLQAFTSSETLKEFIFSPQSWLFTGNDNDEAPPNFYDVESIAYQYKLVVEECLVAEKFAAYPDRENLENALRRVVNTHPSKKNYSDSFGLMIFNTIKNSNLPCSFDDLDKNIIYLYRNLWGSKKPEKKVLQFKIDKI